jgi:hypothetical protein
MKVSGKIKPAEYTMFLEAWSCLAMARLMLVFRPFKKILPFLRSGEKNVEINVNSEILQQIKLSIARACVRSPWRTRCFEQALAAKMMLNRRKISSTIFFGVKKENTEELAAHAWVKSGEFIVTGWQKVKEYTVVGSF